MVSGLGELHSAGMFHLGSIALSLAHRLWSEKVFVGVGGRGKIVVSLCDKQSCGRLRAAGQGQRKAWVGNVSGLSTVGGGQ